MNIFAEKKFAVILIIVLVILNIGTLTMLWIGRPDPGVPPGGGNRITDENHVIAGLLKTELDFSDRQIKEYLEIRSSHIEKVSELNNEIRRLKNQMFDEVLDNVPEPRISDSLLTLAQSRQNQVERLTFDHFLELKKICNPEQQTKLRKIFHRLFARKAPGPR